MDKMEKKENIELVESRWDKKKLVVAVLLLFLFAGTAYAAKKYIVGDSSKPINRSSVRSGGEVAGVRTTSTENKDTDSENSKNESSPFSISSSSIQEAVQGKIDTIKKQVSSLTVDDVASASPQVQKVINDIKALQDYPKTQAKEFCENVCKNF